MLTKALGSRYNIKPQVCSTLSSTPSSSSPCYRDASHPHQTVSQGHWVWLVDLGCDRIRHYRHSEAGLRRGQVT